MASFTVPQWQASFVHEARESLTDRYYVVCAANDLKVFDRATGSEFTVTFPNGKDYLTSTHGFKAATVGQNTYLLNLDTTVRRGTAVAPAQKYEALVVVRETDFGVAYSVVLNGQTFTYTTPPATSPLTQESISTTFVAQQLAQAIFFQLSSTFTVNTFGSALYIVRQDGADFTIQTGDGLSDAGLRLIKGTTQNFTDLPPMAKVGMIVNITGDPESTIDDYWVQFTGTGTATLFGTPGVWKECAAPGTPIALDATTMPWVLSRQPVQTTGLTASRNIPMPTVSQIVTKNDASYTSNPDTGALYSGESATISLNNARLHYSIAAGAGSGRSVITYFDVDGTAMDTGDSVTVTLKYNGTTVQSKSFPSGTVVANESLLYTGTVALTDVVELKITYDSNTTSLTDLARITAHSVSNALPGIRIFYVSGVDVAFNATAVYPMEAVLTLTANSVPFVHNVVSADETGLTVANAFATLLGASYTVVNGGDGTFTVTPGGGGPITWTIVPSFTFDTFNFFDPSANLTPGALVGATLYDDTDGSQGTITDNSVHVIVTGGMSNGITNDINDGDAVHIVGVPGTSDTFIFTTGVWDQRKAGDLTTCPLPSFVDQSLEEVFTYRDRLGFTCADHVVCSQTGVFSNFMRQTATQLLPDDVIDVQSALPNTGVFEHAVEWDNVLYLFSTNSKQVALGGSPLTPETVELELRASFPLSDAVRPIPLGRYLFFSRAKSAFSAVMQMFLLFNGKTDAVPFTDDVPKYIPGTITLLAGDPELEMIFAVADGAPDTLWVNSHHYHYDTSPYATQQKVQNSWSKWTFPGVTNILSLSMDDGVLAMLLLRSDGCYLETIDLGNIPDGAASYRDRQGFTTTVPFTSTYTLSTVYLRDGQDDAETRGRLQLRYGSLLYADTMGFNVTVTPQGRAPFVYPFTSASIAQGQMTFPIQTKNEYATISITNNGDVGFAFSSFDWEGDYTSRDRRVPRQLLTD